MAPVVRKDALDANPKIAEVLNRVDAMIDEATMAEMNYKVDGEKQEPKDVARAFLKSKGVVPDHPDRPRCDDRHGRARGTRRRDGRVVRRGARARGGSTRGGRTARAIGRSVLRRRFGRWAPNTGKVIPHDELAAYQQRAVRARAVGVGARFPTDVVRATMFARAGGHGRGRVGCLRRPCSMRSLRC